MQTIWLICFFMLPLFCLSPQVQAQEVKEARELTRLRFEDPTLPKESFSQNQKALAEFRVPPELILAVDPKVAFDKKQIWVTATLSNPTIKKIPITVFPVSGQSPFYAFIASNDQVHKRAPKDPQPDLAPPPPMEIILPPRSQIEFRAVINLKDYRYRGTPEAQIEWGFEYWNGPKPKGQISVTLPKR